MDNEKKIILAIAVYAAIMVMVFHSLDVKAQGAVKNAIAINEEGSHSLMVDEDVADFLVRSADARMMYAQEGLLASRKGTDSLIREYGQRMMKDQSMLLEKIKTLAIDRNVFLPSAISNRRVGGHQNLSEETGTEFDEKFIKMIVTDHERDIKLFKKATQYKDPDVSAFAQRYLPLIQSHLQQIKKIKTKLNY